MSNSDNLLHSRDATDVFLRHPPYVISMWNRLYRNKDASPKDELEHEADPWTALDDVARAIVRSTAGR